MHHPKTRCDGHIECFHAAPKVPYRRLVEVLGGVHVANVRMAGVQRPLAAGLRGGALQLVTSGRRVLERNSGEAGESVGMCRRRLRCSSLRLTCATAAASTAFTSAACTVAEQLPALPQDRRAPG